VTRTFNKAALLLAMVGVSCRTAGAPPARQNAAAPGQVDPTRGLAPPQALAVLAVQYWDTHLRDHPLQATELGDRRFDDRLPDSTPAGRARELTALAALRERVAAVPVPALSPGDRVTRSLLLGEIDSDLALGSCALDDWAVDARDGTQVVFLRLPELQPVRTPADGWKLVARWEKMGGFIDQETANLRSGLAAGKVATAAELHRVIAQLDDLLAKPDDKWPLRAPAATAHADWPAPERLAFARAIDAAIAGAIRPAFERYRAALRGEILPRARDEAHAGISNVPGGAACYEKLVKVHTSLELPAAEIHRIGLEELARIHAEMLTIGKKAFGVGTLPELRRKLRGGASAFFRTRDEVETAARKALARAQAAEPRFLGRLPRTPCVVKRIEEFEEKDAPIAYYRPAAIDGSRPAAYFVNTYKPETRARYEVEALAFHESVPGHHIQIAIAQELTGLPEFRKQAGVTAFVEGWGLYAEGLADELGLYKGARERLGRLNFDAWRASRLVVDTGIHALGWSRSKAIAFFEENAILATDNVVNEVDRYIAWPGQALAYKMGEREIRRLRADAEKRLGPKFDVKAFHDLLLSGGAVSLPVLREQVDAWIAAASPPATPPPTANAAGSQLK
jgi:uncharacterized protein (DUF885 family)